VSILDQIGAAIKRNGWSRTARESGVDRTPLHRAFGNKPLKGTSLKTIERVLPALGLELTVRKLDR